MTHLVASLGVGLGPLHRLGRFEARSLSTRPGCARSCFWNEQKEKNWTGDEQRGRIVRRAAVSLAMGICLVCVPPLLVEPARIAVAMKEPLVGAVNPSSVESILARQLARRFLEMNDEELAEVLEQLLRASKTFTGLSGETPLTGQESLNREVTAEIERRSITKDGKSRVEKQGAGVSIESSGQELHPESGGSARIRSSIQGDSPPGNNTEAGNGRASIPEAGNNNASSDSLAPERRLPDSGDNKTAGDKDNADESDLTGLLWKEFQKRVEPIGARDLANMGVKDKTLARKDFDLQDLVRDPTAVTVLALNAALTVAQWKYLDYKNKRQPIDMAKNLATNSSARSQASSKISKDGNQNLPESLGIFQSMWSRLGTLFDQVRDSGKKMSNDKGKQQNEDDARELQTGLQTSRQGLSSKEEVPFSAKLASIRKASSERQSSGNKVTDTPLLMDKRVSRATDVYERDVPVKFDEQGVTRFDNKRIEGDSDGPKSLSALKYRSGMGVEGKSGRGSLVEKAITLGEKGSREASLSAPLNFANDSMRAEEASFSFVAKSERSKVERPVGRLTEPGYEEVSKRFKTRIEAVQIEGAANSAFSNGCLQVEKDLHKGNSRTSEGEVQDKNNHRWKAENPKYANVDSQDLANFKRIDVDYWADCTKSTVPSKISSELFDQLEKDAPDVHELATDGAKDEFVYKGELWSRDKDGVFVKVITPGKVLSSLTIMEDKKPAELEMNDQSLGVGGNEEKPGLNTSLEKQDLSFKESTKSRRGTFRLRRGQKSDKPVFDYSQLVLQKEKNDIPLERLNTEQSKKVSLSSSGSVYHEQRSPV